MHPETSLSPLQSLAAKWRVIGLMLAALAQLMRRSEDGCTPGTAERCHELACVARTAQVMICQDMRDTLAVRAPNGEADENALAHLRVIAICLIAISLVAERIGARARSALCWMGARSEPPINSLMYPERPFPMPPFLDSG